MNAHAPSDSLVTTGKTSSLGRRAATGHREGLDQPRRGTKAALPEGLAC